MTCSAKAFGDFDVVSDAALWHISQRLRFGRWCARAKCIGVQEPLFHCVGSVIHDENHVVLTKLRAKSNRIDRLGESRITSDRNNSARLFLCGLRECDASRSACAIADCSPRQLPHAAARGGLDVDQGDEGKPRVGDDCGVGVGVVLIEKTMNQMRFEAIPFDPVVGAKFAGWRDVPRGACQAGKLGVGQGLFLQFRNERRDQVCYRHISPIGKPAPDHHSPFTSMQMRQAE